MRAKRKALTPLLLAGALLSGCTAPPPGIAEPLPAAAPVRSTPAEGSAPPGGGWPGADPLAYPPGGTATDHADTGRCDGGSSAGVLATIPLDHRPIDLVLDAGASTLYISSELGTAISVVHTGSRAVAASIPLRDRPYGLFLDAERGALYAPLAGVRVPGGAVAVIDTERRALVRSIRFPDARWPTDAVIDPATGLLFVVNSGDDTVAVFDSASGDRIRRIPVDVDPMFVEVVSDSGVVLVAGAKGLAAIDVRTLAVRDTLPMPSGAMAVDEKDGGVFVANQGFGTVSVVDLAAFEVVGRVAVGGRGPFDIAYDAASGLAYVTGTAHGELTLIDMAPLKIVERIGGADGSRAWYGAVAVDDTTDCVYVADLEQSAIAVLERRS
ncbi:YncE family protein [Lysobacter korlensis]|uniref:YncE family protein n=1 Tax=Lysobacter korlensis TaxID=553636 RepID=A0ABV6RQU1_9GAMM